MNLKEMLYTTAKNGYWRIEFYDHISVMDWIELSSTMYLCGGKFNDNCFQTQKDAEKFITDYMEPYIVMRKLCGDCMWVNYE